LTSTVTTQTTPGSVESSIEQVSIPEVPNVAAASVLKDTGVATVERPFDLTPTISPVPTVYHTSEVNVNGYYPTYPGSDPQAWAKWWHSTGHWEFPHISRAPIFMQYWNDYMRYARELEIMSQIEFTLTRRCIPLFKKEVGSVVVAVCPQEVWISLSKRFCSQCKPDRYSFRKKMVPNPGWFTPEQQQARNDFFLQRFTWIGPTNLPSLIHEFWFLLKWLSNDGVLYRASIKKLSLCYDSFFGSIKCDLEYSTEFYNDHASMPAWAFV